MAKNKKLVAAAIFTVVGILACSVVVMEAMRPERCGEPVMCGGVLIDGLCDNMMECVTDGNGNMWFRIKEREVTIASMVHSNVVALKNVFDAKPENAFVSAEKFVPKTGEKFFVNPVMNDSGQLVYQIGRSACPCVYNGECFEKCPEFKDASK